MRAQSKNVPSLPVCRHMRMYTVVPAARPVMLFSGNKARPAYRRTSFFGSIELPLLNTNQITGATIYVASQRPDLPIYEPCGQGSMALLMQDLLKIGMDNSTINCINDPRVGERAPEAV